MVPAVRGSLWQIGGPAAPQETTVYVGQGVQMRASLNGQPVRASWVSDDTTIATVTSGGAVVTRAAGVAHVRAVPK